MSFAQLLTWIAPLTLVSMLSPLMLVKSSTIFSELGAKGARRFLAGNIIVLAVVGTASMGLFGHAASNWVGHQLASSVASIILGTLLLGYGCYLVTLTIREQRRPERGREQTVAIPSHGIFMFGLLGAATDVTGLPLFIAIAQHIGSADISWPSRVVTLVTVGVFNLWAVWLPLVLGKRQGYQAVIARLSRQLFLVTRWAALLGSFLGAALMLGHALAVL